MLKLVYTNPPLFTNFIAEISVNPTLFEGLKQQMRFKSNKGCFIFRFQKLISYLPKLKSQIETNGDNAEDATSSIELDFTEKIIEFKGELIGYYLYETMKNDE